MNETTERSFHGKVLEAVSLVSSDLCAEGIDKMRRNQQQGYAFRGIDDVYQVLSPLLVKHRLLIIPSVLSRTETTRESKSGGAIYSVAVNVMYRLVSVDDGSAVDVTVWGEAMDSADKATNKAMSAAYKYMAVMTFCIPLRGVEDADATTPPATVPSQAKSSPEAKAPKFETFEDAKEAVANAQSTISLKVASERIKSSSFGPGERAELVELWKQRSKDLDS